MKVYYQNDAQRSYIKNKTIAVIGYGSQGHAHALNLKESGCTVLVGLYEGSPSIENARRAGLTVVSVEEAAKQADIVMMLIPDIKQADVYTAAVLPQLGPGKSLAFAHGFAVHFGQVSLPAGVDVWMVAPKGPGHLVRRTYQQGSGVPCLAAVYRNASGKAFETALAYADAIGGTRAGVLETTFAEETETDLFGEQAVLCGGVSELIKAGFETLVEAGYQPEIAYFECLHELKLIVDLIYEGGIGGMYHWVSDTAEYGGLTRGGAIVTKDTKENMKRLLKEIQDGYFAQEWISENRANHPVLNAKRHQLSAHSIESVGKRLREMMTWIAREKE